MSIARVLALLLVTTTLAGCAGADDSPEEPADLAGTVTDPTDYSYLEGQTDGSGWHVHDYWRGQDSLTLWDDHQDIRVSCGQGVTCTYGFGVGRLPAGTIVPQGTAYVNITLSWTIDTPHPDPELFVRTAADKQASAIGTPTNGLAMRFNSSNDQNDPPHQSLSGWAFPVRFSIAASEGYDFEGSLSIRIIAVRGLEIPAYPPHPDLWRGSDRIPLFEGEERLATLMERHGTGGWSCTGVCQWGAHSPGDGTIVPYDAAEVEVVLEYGAGLPTGLRLAYQAADKWELETIRAEESSPGMMIFRIPVTPAQGDSPYAKQSLWRFQPEVDEQPIDPDRWSGSYTLSAWAVKSS